MPVKTCSICGKSFNAPKGNIKYCSLACRSAGNQRQRKQWEKQTGYAEKQRIATQKRREEQTAVRNEIEEQEQKKRIAALERKAARILKKSEEELKRKAASGDPWANMEIAQRSCSHVDYWHWFKKYEIDYSESWGRKSTRTVNGISVYDPDFEIKVIGSIEQTGQCISMINGQGERIDKQEVLTKELDADIPL